MVEEMTALKGEFIRVTINRRIFLVQRHYIALHGLKGSEVHRMGFQEITGEATA